MYKLLIVDDEALVREAVREQMNWEQLGFVCIGDCEDGVEALEFAERDLPDVVLTDIGMPFMDGLELTRELSALFPSVQVVILTGYDDFDYAQQAVKLKAVDYILKPVTALELERVMVKLREELDAQKQKKQDDEQLKRQWAENFPLLKERFLERLVTSPMTAKQKAVNAEYFRIQWNGGYAVELAIDVDEFELTVPQSPMDEELIRFAIFNVTQEIAVQFVGSEAFRDRENRVLLLLSGADPEELLETALQAAEQVHQAVSTYLPVKASIGIGYPDSITGSVTRVHESALSALAYRFVIGSNSVIRISDMEQHRAPEILSVVAWENELITKLKTGTPQEMEDWVTSLFQAFREQVFPIGICHLYLQRIVLTLMHTLYEMESTIPAQLGGAESPVHQITRFAALDETEAWMKLLCMHAVQEIRRAREDQSALQVTKAIEFVRHHYSDPDLSVKSVCRHVSMSASYFSFLFKLHTGKTFIEFVTHERMEKAKELLKFTTMKSYEIAYEVGYGDPHYFSGAFKKITGETPTDYRQKMTTKKA